MNEEKIAGKIFTELKKLVPAESLEKIARLISEKVSREKGKVVVTLATSPSAELVLKLSGQVENLFGSKTVIEYHVRPEIVGGFILEGQGRYYDYSLEKRINKLLKNE